jgi:hypothetical protein
MGAAAFLVWRQGLARRDVKISLGVFLFQLLLNAGWSIIFFGLHNTGWAFVEIIALWLSILSCILLFRRISIPAAYLLLPYIIWVSFAAYLNLSIWFLNSGIADINPEAYQLPELAATDSLWRDSFDVKNGVYFSYPLQLGADYASPVYWPPVVSSAIGSFSCVETPGTASLPSRVIKRMVDQRVYCVEAMSEGAAGSVYTDYTYSTERDGRIVKVNFTLRYPQCDNYDDPEKSDCRREREAFDLDATIDRIAASVRTGN